MFSLLLFMAVATLGLARPSVSQSIRSSVSGGVTETAGSRTNPLDQLSSAKIANQVAVLVRMPEVTAVKNKADSEKALLGVLSNDSTTIAKPLIVSTAQKSKKDIFQYTAQPTDTLDSIALKFGLSLNSLRWSNNLTGNFIPVGKALLIPPGNGIVYKVKNGDTIDGVTQKYQADRNAFISVNDAENGGLNPGELVWIPNVQQPLPNLSFNVASGGGFAWGYGPVYQDNGYDYGYCTWWAALRRAQIGRPVPSNLGNAVTWKALAPVAGLGIGRQAQPGAVYWIDPATMSGYWRSFGHVGFVEKINPDGSVWTSDMNSSGYASMDTNSARAGGWGRVSYRYIPASEVTNYWYIY